MYYGGWGHCNMVRLAPDLLRIVPFDDGTLYKEVTPANYTEGPFMLRHRGKYYFMWSEGGWTGPDYCVAYAIADSPFGPFERIGSRETCIDRMYFDAEGHIVPVRMTREGVEARPIPAAGKAR